MSVINMTTIAVSEEVKRELLKFVSELQIKLGRRVDFDEAIRFLLARSKKKNQRLLLEACTPTKIGADETLKELYMERKRDEELIKETQKKKIDVDILFLEDIQKTL